MKREFSKENIYVRFGSQTAFLVGLLLFFLVVVAFVGKGDEAGLTGLLRTNVLSAQKQLNLTPVEVGESALTRDLSEDENFIGDIVNGNNSSDGGDRGGQVLGTGDANDACRDSHCGGEECTVDGGGFHGLGGNSGSFTVNFKGSGSTVPIELAVKKITFPNQVMAGVRSNPEGLAGTDKNSAARAYYPISNTDFNYPSISDALDIYQGMLSPLEVSESWIAEAEAAGVENISDLLQEGACMEMYKADTGPFATHVKLLSGGDGMTVTGEDQPVAVMKGWLDEKAINPDKTNKLAQIFLMMDKAPNEVAANTSGVGEFSREGSSGNVMEKSGEGAPIIIDLSSSSDNYIAEIGGIGCRGSYSTESSFFGDAELSAAQYAECIATDGSRGCTKDFPAILELSSIAGSNYSCEAGHCSDMFYDNAIAQYMSPAEITGELDTPMSELIDREATAMHADADKKKADQGFPTDVYIRDVYATTNCSVSVRNGAGGSVSVPCVHPAPNSVQGHLILSLMGKAPYEVMGLTAEQAAAGVEPKATLEEKFWHTAREYWAAQGESCKE